MSTDTTISDTTVAGKAASKPLRSGEVIKILNIEWGLSTDRETLARISDSIGVAVRPSPHGQRRWTRDEVDEIAAVLAVRQSDILARGVAEALLKDRDEPVVRMLFDAVTAVLEHPGLRLSAETTAA